MSNHAIMWVSIVASSVVFLATLVGVPIAIVRAPADYFVRDRTTEHRNILRVIARNILGVIVLVAGVAMLFLPGQGILTMIVGIALLDVPGKDRVLLNLLRRPAIQRVTTALRRRAGRPPFQLQADTNGDAT